MTTHQLTLPGQRRLTVTETTDHATSTVTYLFQGPRAEGVVDVIPCHTALQTDRLALPNGVRITFGTGGTCYADRLCRPVVNGITLAGDPIIDPFEYVFHPRKLYFDRWTRSYSTPPAPSATNEYMNAIIHAILNLWISRPDADELVRATARRSAAARLATLRHGPIRDRTNDITAAAAELARLEALAAQLAELADEYTAQTHPQEVTTP